MRACKAPEPLTSAPTSERIPESRLPRGAGRSPSAARCSSKSERRSQAFRRGALTSHRRASKNGPKH
jgi:hypothetical protein